MSEPALTNWIQLLAGKYPQTKGRMMSDVMLLGVLRMPWDTKDDFELIQIQSRMHQAANRIESDRKRIEELEAKLDRYTRLSESGESLGGELEERERRMELEARLAAAEKHTCPKCGKHATLVCVHCDAVIDKAMKDE